MSMQLFYYLMVDILGLPLPSADLLSSEVTVTDKEARPAPSHHHTAVAPADSG